MQENGLNQVATRFERLQCLSSIKPWWRQWAHTYRRCELLNSGRGDATPFTQHVPTRTIQHQDWEAAPTEACPMLYVPGVAPPFSTMLTKRASSLQVLRWCSRQQGLPVKRGKVCKLRKESRAQSTLCTKATHVISASRTPCGPHSTLASKIPLRLQHEPDNPKSIRNPTRYQMPSSAESAESTSRMRQRSLTFSGL